MPEFKVNTHNPKGHFILTFKPNSPSIFYGNSGLSELEVFKRYGNLPDNHLAVNKLIHALGTNLLHLEEKAQSLRTNQLDAFSPETNLQNEKSFYNSLERTSNALSIDLLCTLAPLEQLRGAQPKTFSQEERAVIQKKITEHYENYSNYYESLLKGESDPIKINRITAIVTRLQQQKVHLNALINTLEVPISNNQLRDVYQTVLYDFKDLQNQITFYQRPFLGALEFANESTTEAYQNASYALESHEFSLQTPTDKQLWQFNPKDETPVELSTEQLPAMRHDNALKTQALFASQQQGTMSKHYKALKDTIKTQNLQSKISPPVVIEKKSEPNPLAKPIQDLQALEVALQAQPLSHKRQLLANPVLRHEYSDMFSALGEACFSFGKYFEREMAAKHPVMTSGLFLASSISFGAAGLGSVGVSPALMGHIVNNMAQILTLGGATEKVGLSTLQMQGVINAISSEWLTLTHSQATAFHALVMDGFALPKIVYTLVDTLINGIEDQDTLTQLCERLSPEDLEGKTNAEKNQEIITNIAVMALLLGAAVGVGLGAEAITKMGNLPDVVRLIAHAIDSFIEVPLDAFTDVSEAKDATEQCVAIVSMLTTIESAGLFLGKGALLFTHMNEPPLPTREAVQVIGLLLDMKSMDSEAFNHFIETNPLSEDLKQHFIQALETYPELKEQLGEQAAFFNALGLSALNPPPLTLVQSVLDFLGTAALAIPAFIYGAISSPFWALASLGSSKYDKQLADNKILTPGLPQGKTRNMALTTGKFLANKIILPPLCLLPGILSGLGGVVSGLFNSLSTGRFSINEFWLNNKVFSEGMKPLLGVMKIALMVWAAIKTTSMVLAESLYRIPLFISSVLSNIALISNAIIKGKFLLTGEAIIKKLTCPVLEVVTYPFTQLNGLIQGFISAWKEKPLQSSAAEGNVSLEKTPELSWVTRKTDAFSEGRNKALKNSWFMQLKETDQTASIKLQGVKDADKIIDFRDRIWSSYNQGYEFIKRGFGNAITGIRNLLRSTEDAVQKAEMDRMGHLTLKSKPLIHPALVELGGKIASKTLSAPDSKLTTTTEQSAVPADPLPSMAADEKDLINTVLNLS